jgi:hypothetical protein
LFRYNEGDYRPMPVLREDVKHDAEKVALAGAAAVKVAHEVAALEEKAKQERIEKLNLNVGAIQDRVKAYVPRSKRDQPGGGGGGGGGGEQRDAGPRSGSFYGSKREQAGGRDGGGGERERGGGGGAGERVERERGERRPQRGQPAVDPGFVATGDRGHGGGGGGAKGMLSLSGDARSKLVGSALLVAWTISCSQNTN